MTTTDVKPTPSAAGKGPDYLIVGAAKSATTWWQHALNKHPGLYIPLVELHHFSVRL